MQDHYKNTIETKIEEKLKTPIVRKKPAPVRKAWPLDLQVSAQETKIVGFNMAKLVRRDNVRRSNRMMRSHSASTS